VGHTMAQQQPNERLQNTGDSFLQCLVHALT